MMLPLAVTPASVTDTVVAPVETVARTLAPAVTSVPAGVTKNVAAADVAEGVPGDVTVTATAAAAARSAAAMEAVTREALTKAVGRALPFHCTTEVDEKSIPSTTNVSPALPADALSGFTAVMYGALHGLRREVAGSVVLVANRLARRSHFDQPTGGVVRVGRRGCALCVRPRGREDRERCDEDHHGATATRSRRARGRTLGDGAHGLLLHGFVHGHLLPELRLSPSFLFFHSTYFWGFT